MKARASADTEISGEALLLNDQAGRESIVASLRSIVSTALASDTIVLFFAGHGVRDKEGRLYLATPETRLDDLAGSALAWSEVAVVLREAKARIIVFLDTCHSGAVSDALATNDASSQALVTGARTSMVIFSASKGREFSEEQSARNGGVFTSALIETLASPAADQNGNGALEASELFMRMKGVVVRATDGRQTLG